MDNDIMRYIANFMDTMSDGKIKYLNCWMMVDELMSKGIHCVYSV